MTEHVEDRIWALVGCGVVSFFVVVLVVWVFDLNSMDNEANRAHAEAAAHCEGIERGMVVKHAALELGPLYVLYTTRHGQIHVRNSAGESVRYGCWEIAR